MEIEVLTAIYPEIEVTDTHMLILNLKPTDTSVSVISTILTIDVSNYPEQLPGIKINAIGLSSKNESKLLNIVEREMKDAVRHEAEICVGDVCIAP